METSYDFIMADGAGMWFVLAAIGGVVWLVSTLFSKISEAKQNKKDAAQEQDYLDRIQELTNDKRYEDLFFTMSHLIKICSISGDKFNHLGYYVENLKFACAKLGRTVRESFFDEVLNNSLQVSKDFSELGNNMVKFKENNDLVGFEIWMEELVKRAETFSNSMNEELGITNCEERDPVGWKMKNYKFTYRNLEGEVLEKIVEIPNMED